MSYKKISSTALLLLFGITLLSGQGVATDKGLISSGTKMSARSYITPYHSLETALANKESESDYMIEINSWSSEIDGEDAKWRSRVKIPRSWGERRTIFRIDGVNASFSVNINGREAGYSQAGIGRSEFDITELLVNDYNSLEVVIYGNSISQQIENQIDSNKLKFNHASIISQPNIRVNDIIASTSASGDSGHISLDIAIKSHLRNPKTHTLKYELLSPTGEVVAQSSRDITTSWLSEDTLRFSHNLKNVKRWSHEAPYLYTLVVMGFSEGRYTEFIPIQLGFRQVSFKKNENIYIDNIEVPLYVTRSSYLRDDETTTAMLLRLKEAGFNCVAVSQHPQQDSFYSICDRIGLYVCDIAEINTSQQPRTTTIGGNPSNDPEWVDAYLDRVRTMYLSSRNHPCVVMFAIAEDSANGYCLYESYMALKKFESNRPVIYREADGQWNNDNITWFEGENKVSVDILSFNTNNIKLNNTVWVTNNNMLAPFEGDITFSIKQGDKIVSTLSESVMIMPGEVASVTIPEKKLKKAKREMAIEITAFSTAVYQFRHNEAPAKSYNGKRSNSLYDSKSDKKPIAKSVHHISD